MENGAVRRRLSTKTIVAARRRIRSRWGRLARGAFISRCPSSADVDRPRRAHASPRSGRTCRSVARAVQGLFLEVPRLGNSGFPRLRPFTQLFVEKALDLVDQLHPVLLVERDGVSPLADHNVALIGRVDE